MKKNSSLVRTSYILSFAFVLVLNTLNAQLTCPNFTASGPSSSGYNTPSATTGGCASICAGALTAPSYPWDGASMGAVITATVPAPGVTSLTVAFSSVNADDYAAVAINGGGTMTLTVAGVGLSGNTIGPYLCTGTSNPYGDAFVTITSTLPFTQVTFTNTNGTSGWVINCPGSTPNAGSDSTYNNGVAVCGGSINLNNLLSGADPGGTWAETTTSGQFNTGTGVFTPGGLAPGTYTFTYTVTGCGSNDVANFSVVVGSNVNAGADSTSTLCNTSGSTINLNTLLNGADPGGTWAETTTSGQFTPGTGIFDASGLTAGNYTFTYTVLGTSPCPNDVANFTITVIPKPVFTETGTNPTTCSSTDGKVTIAGLIANMSYTVTYDGNGTTVGPTSITSDGSGNIIISNLAPGNYTNFLIATSGGCSTSDTNTVALIPPSPPTVSPAGSAMCIGGSTTISATGTPAGGTFAWSPATGLSTTTGSSVTANPAVTTVYTVTYTQNGCTATDTAIVTVNPLPTIDAGIDQTVCENGLATLIANNPSSASLSWNHGVSNNVSFTPPVGNTTYTVTAIDSHGCKNKDSMLMTVIPTPTPDFSANKLVSCSPLVVNFTNNSIGTLTNCQWSLSNGQTFTGCGGFTDSLIDVGCYDVTLTVTTPEGCTNTLTKSDYVCVAPFPVASFYTDPQHLTTQEPTANMVNTSTGATSYTWDFGDNSPSSSNENPTHTFPGEESKTYTILLIATSSEGCVDSTTQTISMQEDLIFYVPNTFTPDGDTYNEKFTPVFTSGFDPYGYSLYIYDRWGELLFESHDASIGWDGTYGGKIVQDGTYVWKIDFKLKYTDDHQRHYGNVNVLR